MAKILPKGWKRTRKIQIMITEGQQVSWERAAWSEGMTVVEWLRGLANKASGFHLPVPGTGLDGTVDAALEAGLPPDGEDEEEEPGSPF